MEALIHGGCGGRNTRRSARKAAGAGSPQYRFSQAQQLVPGRAWVEPMNKSYPRSSITGTHGYNTLSSLKKQVRSQKLKQKVRIGRNNEI